jgi:hypothetical protein
MSFEAFMGGVEQEKKRKKLRSRAEYARSRERIPTIESLTTQSEYAKNVADISLALELEPKVQESLKKAVSEILPTTNAWIALSTDQKNTITKKDFTVTVETLDDGTDAVSVNPEGNVAEKLPLNHQLTKSIADGLA